MSRLVTTTPYLQLPSAGPGVVATSGRAIGCCRYEKDVEAVS